GPQPPQRPGLLRGAFQANALSQLRKFSNETFCRSERVIRATLVRSATDVTSDRVIDRVMLDADERHRRRITLTGERGTSFLLDLPHATALRDGDGLVLEDGSIVRVAGKPEALVEITAASPHELARLAWHIGNRHTDVQIVGDKLRIRRDHVLEEMLR